MSSYASASEPGVAIVIGLPLSVRMRLERRFTNRLTIRVIPLKRDGGYRLEMPPRQASSLVEQFADEVPDYENLTLVLLPYGSIPTEVSETVEALRDLGATLFRPASNQDDWPAHPKNFDNAFQNKLLEKLSSVLETRLPRPERGKYAQVIEDVLRGLASHSKMGPNNHSHEDDLWKNRGQGLGPGAREEIVKGLLREGILDRKSNDSAGGKGWVYWIADVAKARALYPRLESYFQ